MATKDTLTNLFDDFGFDMGDSMIERCVDLCLSYTVDPREFVEIFVAFAINNAKSGDITDSTLDEFERKELANQKSAAQKAKNATRTPRNIDLEYNETGSDDESDELMGNYICTTPKAQKPQSRLQSISTPVSSLRSPAPIDSPISVTLKSGAGKVIYTFGTSNLIKSVDWTNNQTQSIQFERLSDAFSADQHYMYDNLLQKTNIAADRIFDVGEEICNKLIKDHSDVYDKELLHQAFKMADPSQSAITCVGRICSDSDCQLDLHSTLLICADEITLQSYRLHFDRMKSFALFPGQTVLVQGVNPRADVFFVDEIHNDRHLTYADPPKLTDNLNIIVASGPYTGQQDLNYEPLHELVAYCKQHKPDVLILIGPFLDADHPSVLDGSIKLPHEIYVENMIASVVNSIGPNTEVFIVSSSQDVHSTGVYPTAPYVQSIPNKTVKYLPDPCMFKMNGVTFGITATDIYNHILDAEIAVNAGDRVKRVTNHLFNQGSFYPLNPSSDKVSVDSTLSQQFAALSTVPNILILRSTAKCFAREVKRPNERGCLVLNPGPMYENSTNGTFSRLIVTPSTDDTAALNSIIACQIIKI